MEHWWKLLIIILIVTIYLILNKPKPSPPPSPPSPPTPPPENIQVSTFLQKIINEGVTREGFDDTEDSLNQRRESLLIDLGDFFSEIGLKICGTKWNSDKPFIHPTYQTELSTMSDLDIILTMIYFSDTYYDTKKLYMSILYLLIQKINNMNLNMSLETINNIDYITIPSLNTKLSLQELYSLSKLSISDEQTFKQNLKEIDNDTINILWERRKSDLEKLKNPYRITGLCSNNVVDPKNCVPGKNKEVVQPCNATCENQNGTQAWKYPIIKNEQAGGKCAQRGVVYHTPCLYNGTCNS